MLGRQIAALEGAQPQFAESVVAPVPQAAITRQGVAGVLPGGDGDDVMQVGRVDLLGRNVVRRRAVAEIAIEVCSPGIDVPFCTARLWNLPAATAVTPLARPSTATGVVRIVVVPSPSWPATLLPQA